MTDMMTDMMHTPDPMDEIGAFGVPRRKIVCFSGHRSKKLPEGILRRMLYSMLYEEIREAVEEGCTVFYTGTAEGVDLWAGGIVIAMQKQNPALRLRLICASPFPTFQSGLKGDARYVLSMVLEGADDVVQVSPHYHRGAFRERNRYMVERSGRLIAVVLDMRSGTGQTIRLARSEGLEMRVISLADAVC